MYSYVYIYIYIENIKKSKVLSKYNLISNCCQFLTDFIKRTRVLVGIVIFKAHRRKINNKFLP